MRILVACDSRFPARRGFLLAAATVFCATARAQSPVVTPWVYDQNGFMVWQRHEYFEDTPNAVFSLAWEFVHVAGEPTARPDVLVFAGPQFDPPENVPAAPGTRKLMGDSVRDRSLRLYVNYSGVHINTISTEVFRSPTFFLSLDGTQENTQTSPPVLQANLSSVTIAATRGALGNVGTLLSPTNMRAPLWHESNASSFPMNALYVTAGIGFAITDLDAASQALAQTASQDRLLIRQANETWRDRSDLIPSAVKDGNSSGACFADFNGDGYMDLFVGKPGDNYVGGQSRLLIYRPPTGGNPESFTDVTSTHLPVVSAATVDVAAADLDRDGDQDIVLADRAVRGGPAGPESIDYALINDGTGHFAAVVLAPGRYTDSRSVAIGELDAVPGPEVVLGNAGSDGFSNTLVVPSGDDHPLQIFKNTHPYPGLNLVDSVYDFIDPVDEPEISRPFTWQVVIADMFTPPGSGTESSPDGHPDLLLVNHRNILLDATLGGGGSRDASNVRILVNPFSTTTSRLVDKGRLDVRWATTVALGDFTQNNDPNFGTCSPGTLDLFVAAGNTHSGCDTVYFENMGAAAGGWPPWNQNGNLIIHLSYDAMPGNERGYGFDFADVDGDGTIDAVQASRGYDFFVSAIRPNAVHSSYHHWNLTLPASAVQLSNDRGQLLPQGAEDGVFADFDGDGFLDLLLATQNGPSGSYPASPPPEIGETSLLRNPGTPPTQGFNLSTTTVPATDVPSGGSPNITVDSYVDINHRDAYYRPKTADRAAAVDLDNDGRDDAIVHLFPIFNPSSGGQPLIPQLGTSGLTSPVSHCSAGWRYLQNVCAGSGATPPWLKDVAARKLHDGSYAAGFSVNWNRALGVDLLADFDNNGACDFFTAVGGPMQVGTDVSVLEQGYDLIFMNGIGGAPVGEFIESSVAFSLPRRTTGAPATKTIGCSGLACGDVDNDGYADLLVACGGREYYSELLMNHLATLGRFDDEFQTRVPTLASALSPVVHSSPFYGDPTHTHLHDEAGSPLLIDLDGDGDLDLVYAVKDNVPRFFINGGVDSNGDGYIDSTDTPPPGKFYDATSTFVMDVRPIVDSVDAQAVDLDRDGDLDVAIDCFDDEVVILRNDVAQIGAKPAVTEAWPRVGAKRGRTVVLEGVQLTGALAVELKSVASGAVVSIGAASITSLGAARISFTMPANAPLGLVQIRVRRAGAPTPADEWSTQHFGYYVLGP